MQMINSSKCNQRYNLNIYLLNHFLLSCLRRFNFSWDIGNILKNISFAKVSFISNSYKKVGMSKHQNFFFISSFILIIAFLSLWSIIVNNVFVINSDFLLLIFSFKRFIEVFVSVLYTLSINP